MMTPTTPSPAARAARPKGRHWTAPQWGLVVLLLAAPGCPSKQPPQLPDTGAVTQPDDQPPDVAVADISYDPKAPDDPKRLPREPKLKAPEVAVRFIVVKYLSAHNAAGFTRSKEDARRRAELLVKVARKRDVDFVQLARKHSDAAEDSRGAVVRVGPDEQGFAKIGFDLGLGQVSDVIDAPSGFYIVQRVEPEEYSSAHILVMYEGTPLAPVAFKRTKAEARKKAESVLKQVLAGKTRFSVLAARLSDSPSGALRGGVIAPLVAGKTDDNAKAMQPYLEALMKTKVGQVHPEVVETAYGFHVIRRLRLRKVLVAHILIAHNESEKFKPRTPRDKWVARALAERLQQKAAAAGADFEALVRENSDDQETVAKGGRLPPFAPGEMPPRVEQFAFALKVGQVSAPVETEFGFHILRRLR